jgi:hypothetical protein
MSRGKTSIPSSSDDSSSDDDEGEGKLSLDDLAKVVNFLRMFALNKTLNLKPWKISLLALKMIINVC